MKPKRKLKKWVRLALLMLPEAIIICQLFFVGINLKQIKDYEKENAQFLKDYICTYDFYWGCYYE